jgi:hypothetical protein
LALAFCGVTVREYVRVFAHELRACDPGAALLLAVGRNRTDGKPHAHGAVLTALPRADVLVLWCSVSGASPAAHGCRASTLLTGWAAYARTGDPDDPGTTREGASGRRQCTLRRNLRSVLVYAFVKNVVGDLAHDVVASGVLAPVWAGVLADVSGGGEDPPPPGAPRDE